MGRHSFTRNCSLVVPHSLLDPNSLRYRLVVFNEMDAAPDIGEQPPGSASGR